MSNILTKKIKQFFQNRKIKLIYKLGYRFFYDIFEYETTGVCIPDFLQQEQRKIYARTKTTDCIKQIIKNDSLNKCYKSALAYEKKLLANKLKTNLKNLFQKQIRTY